MTEQSADHARMEAKIEKLSEQFGQHQREFRAHIDGHGQMEETIMEMGRDVRMVVDLLYGEPHDGPDGALLRDGGLQELVRQSLNGGVKVHIPAGLWVFLGTIVTALAGIIVAMIT